MNDPKFSSKTLVSYNQFTLLEEKTMPRSEGWIVALTTLSSLSLALHL